jgi:hypothetical protein
VRVRGLEEGARLTPASSAHNAAGGTGRWAVSAPGGTARPALNAPASETNRLHITCHQTAEQARSQNRIEPHAQGNGFAMSAVAMGLGGVGGPHRRPGLRSAPAQRLRTRSPDGLPLVLPLPRRSPAGSGIGSCPPGTGCTGANWLVTASHLKPRFASADRVPSGTYHVKENGTSHHGLWPVRRLLVRLLGSGRATSASSTTTRASPPCGTSRPTPSGGQSLPRSTRSTTPKPPCSTSATPPRR